jgi:hypothetical protein
VAGKGHGDEKTASRASLTIIKMAILRVVLGVGVSCGAVRLVAVAPYLEKSPPQASDYSSVALTLKGTLHTLPSVNQHNLCSNDCRM